MSSEQLQSDIKVDKYRISGFWDTPLDSILRNLGTRSILFTGVNTDQCVMHSLTDANFLGYGCLLVKDCCATTSPDFCTEATVWNVQEMLRLRRRLHRRDRRVENTALKLASWQGRRIGSVTAVTDKVDFRDQSRSQPNQRWESTRR